jgi:fructose-specific component phosphotransferase system IIB-like protein
MVSFQITSPGVLAAAEAVSVPAGTALTLALEDGLHPDSALVGQKVFFRVVNPVVIDGKTVIAAGARATGEVTHSQKKGPVGKPAVIGVMLRHVEAVDGSMVPVTGVKRIEGENKQTDALIITILCCILGLVIQGGEAELIAGTQVDATVDLTTTVNVDGPERR